MHSPCCVYTAGGTYGCPTDDDTSSSHARAAATPREGIVITEGFYAGFQSPLGTQQSAMDGASTAQAQGADAIRAAETTARNASAAVSHAAAQVASQQAQWADVQRRTGAALSSKARTFKALEDAHATFVSNETSADARFQAGLALQP